MPTPALAKQSKVLPFDPFVFYEFEVVKHAQGLPSPFPAAALPLTSSEVTRVC